SLPSFRYKLVDQGSLAIKGVRVSDSGLYVCKARNVYATKETTPAYLTVLVPPHLVSFTDIVTGAAGGTLEMVCRVGGDPRPEVFWERVSPGELPVERMTQEESGQVLRIRHATPEDQGQYVCKAENPVGAVKANITLKVHSHPVISKMPENARVALKGVAVFECEASGSPLPTSYWTVEGKGDILEPSQSWDNGRITVDEHNTLTIKEVTSKDAGYYVCAAVGIAGSAIARAHLEVLDPSDMPPPIIALGAPNQTLPLGTEGEMPCDARGTPEPKVQWYIGNKLFEPSKRASVSPLGTLRITNLQMSDTATYVCKATSLSGTSVWTTTLTVAKPTNPNVAFFKMPNEGALPEPPGNVMVQLINSTSLTLGWRRGRSGSSSVLGYTVQMWSPDLKGQWTTATTKPAPSAAMPVSVIVTGLKPNTRYIFTVRASNSHGLSRPSDTTHIVRTLMAGTKGELPLSQVRTRLSSAAIRLVSLKAVSAVALEVNMTLLAEPSIIEGIHIRYRSVDERKTNNNPYGALNMV
ncbi:Protein sax-3, partial [Armadillidium vulgare]